VATISTGESAPTPPAAPQDAANGGATPSLAAEPLHPLEARRASLIARLYMAGFAKVDGPAEHLWRFNGPNGAVLIPVGHPCEVERDFADMLDHAEKECAKVEAAAMPADAVEPSVGDVDDAPLFVGSTDSAPTQPMSPDLAAIAARGQQPTAPGPTLAEVQAELARERLHLRKRADEAKERLHLRTLADEAKAELAAIAALLDPEDAPAYDSDDQPIPLPVRVQTALMPHSESLLVRGLRAEKDAFWGIINDIDWIAHHCGSYGATDALADRVLRLLPIERQRAILELKRSEANIEVLRINARFLNPPPPERVAELVAKVATLDARIAALDAG
jgi:hypothetical protein